MDLTNSQNAQIDAALYTFQNAMEEAGRAAWMDIEPLLISMDLDPAGKLIWSDANELIYTQTLGEIMRDAQASTEYRAGIQDLADIMTPLRDETDDYYTTRFEVPQSYRSMSRGLVTTMGGTTTGHGDLWRALGSAADGGVNFEPMVVTPANNALLKHVENGSTQAAMLKDMQYRINDRFVTFSRAPATDIMSVFIRRLNEIYSRYSKDAWYRYEGPNDHVIREFCLLKIDAAWGGPFYHRKQVEAWPEEWKQINNGELWDGAVPGTDRGSIFVNLGGYNCRHALVLVNVEEVPAATLQNWENTKFEYL